MASFAKAVGGCPTNIAIGTARLGLKSGLITRVGDEQMGRFIREQCAREGVDVDGRPDRSGAPDRAGAARRPRRKDLPADLLPRELRRHRARRRRHRSRHSSPSAKPSLVTGTHFARANTDAAQRKAMRIATAAWAQGRLRHRLPAEPLGPRRPWRGRGALHQVGRGHEAAAATSCRNAISSSAPKRR